MEAGTGDSSAACELFSQALANVADKISNDDMRLFLLVGAYLYQRAEQDMDSTLEGELLNWRKRRLQ